MLQLCVLAAGGSVSHKCFAPGWCGLCSFMGLGIYFIAFDLLLKKIQWHSSVSFILAALRI